MPSFQNREEYEQWKAGKAKKNIEDRKHAEIQGKVVLFKTLALIMRGLSAITGVIIVIFLIGLIAPHLGNASSYLLIAKALSIEESLTAFLKSIIPTEIAGIDLARWIFIVGAFMLGGWLNSLKHNYYMKSKNVAFKSEFESEFEELKKKMHLSDNAKVLAPIREKLNADNFNKEDRSELLKLFANTKKKLDMMGRDLSFLAIDVVGSTQMKVGEEKALVERDFMEFKKFADEKIKSNGAMKSAWTPDGAMVCFPSVDSAVKSAQEVIIGLENFNKHVKLIKGDFRVRCGINSGFVYYDEKQPMEEMSDRVIDVAGHMQKQAEPNNICIAKPAIEPMQKGEGFTPSSKVVDGYEMYIWERK